MANNVTLSYPSAFHHQFLDRNGKPLTGGKLYTYSAGTPTPIPTYKTIGDISSTNTNTNPIILDNAGMAYIVIETDKAYKFVLFDKNDAKIAEWDNVTGNICGGGGSSEDIVVVGTPNEIDVSGSVIQGVKRYVISLSNSVKITILQLIGLYNNVLNSLGNKADKVQGATAGNLAALDASGNLTDSGSKVADFKTKQTPVAAPSASGYGLEFIDSVTQDANGEITPHKKSVQDGTTAQKGVVQLQDSIGSTESSTDKAVTPHAVREAINAAVSSAYHAAGTKSVAQLTISLLVAENEGCVYNITDSGTTTSDFVDGAGHTINAGDNVGVCDVGGGVYKFDLLSGFVDLGNYLTKTGDASNTTSTFTKASGDTSTMTSGSKLSALFTAISSFFASLKALAFKDKASYNDLSSGVQSSLDKADSALQSHQSVTDNNPTLSWGTTSKVGSVGSTDLRVTMPTLDTAMSDSSDNAVKNKVVDAALKAISRLWREIIGETAVDLDNLYVNDGMFKLYEWGYASRNNVSNKPVTGGGELVVLSYSDNSVMQLCMDGSDGTKCYVRQKNSSGWTDWFDIRSASWINSGTFDAARIPNSLPNVTAGRASKLPATQVGSTTTPIYVDSNGQVQPCDPSSMSVLNASKASAANKLKDEYGSSFSVGYDAVPINFLDGVPRACANKYAYTQIYKGSASRKFDIPLQQKFGVSGSFSLWLQPGDANTFRWRIYTQMTGGTQYNTNYWNASITGMLRVRGHAGAYGVDQPIDDITEIAATVPVPEGTPRWVDLYTNTLNTQVKQILMGEMLLNVSQGGTGASGASSPFMLRISFTMVSEIGGTTSTVNAIIEAYSYN